MSKKDNTNPSQQTIAEAMGIAKSTQKPGQTKEQTKLIAQGIQKGIEQYKKTYKQRRRELDKQNKKVKAKAEAVVDKYQTAAAELTPPKPSKLPWILLGLSWLGFAVFEATTRLL